MSAPRPRQPQASRVQTPVDVFLDDLALSVRSFDFRPTDTFDCFLAVEFAVEVLCEYEVLPQVFETAFESLLEYLGLGQVASLRNLSNSVGNLGGHTVWLLGNVLKSVS